MPTRVVIRKLTDGTEGDRILDHLEGATGLHSERVEAGRTYDLSGSRDLIIAMTSIKAELDAISDTWSVHLEIDPARID